MIAKHLKYLPLVVPAAIAGMAIVSLLTPHQSKAGYIDYADSVLSIKRLSTIKYFAIDWRSMPDGVLVFLDPQSAHALHSQFGPPATMNEWQDIYLVRSRGQDAGIAPEQQIVFYYEETSGGIKATSALIPHALVNIKH